MVALWQESQGLFLLEFVQTHRTLGSFNQTFVSFVLAHCDGVYDGLLQPHRGNEPHGVVNLVLVEKLLSGGV